MHGAVNARDIGGVAARGRTVAHGRLLRSETPEVYSAEDVDRMVGFGVSLVVDLRMPLHAPDGSGALGRQVRRELVDFVALSGGRPGEGPGLSAEGWMPGMLDRAGPAVVAFLETLCANSSGATLVHCHTGKDRTGFIVALTLRVLGVGRADIAADYLASAPVHDTMVANLKAMGRWHAEAPPFALEAASPVAIEALLDRLDAEWPNIDEYLVASGGAADLGARVRAHLLSSARATAPRSAPPCLVGSGQGDHDADTSLVGGVDTDLAAVPFDDVPGDRQPESGSAGSAGARFVEPGEPFEDPFPLVVGDAGPVVGHRRRGRPVRLTGGEDDQG